MPAHEGSGEIPEEAHVETLCHSMSNSSRLCRKNSSFHFGISDQSQKETELQTILENKRSGFGFGFGFLGGKTLHQTTTDKTWKTLNPTLPGTPHMTQPGSARPQVHAVPHTVHCWILSEFFYERGFFLGGEHQSLRTVCISKFTGQEKERHLQFSG